MRKKNPLEEKAFEFAVMVVKSCSQMCGFQDAVIAKQLIRSGTSIGANIREALNAESKKDFIHKLSIALKEAGETEYWLELLVAVGHEQDESVMQMLNAAGELNRLLISIIRKSKKNAL